MRRWLPALVSAVAALVVAATETRDVLDFGLDWISVRAFVAGIDPYQPAASLGEQVGASGVFLQPWVHPRLPGVLVLQAPISVIPFEWLNPVGRTLVVFSAFFCMWTVGRIVGKRWIVYTTPLVLAVPPFSQNLHLGQTGFWIAGLIGLTWLVGDRWTAGIPLGIAVTWKLWPWLIVPALWLAGRRKAAYSAAGVVAGLNLIGVGFGVPTGSVVLMLDLANNYLSASLSTSLGWPAWFAAVVGLLVLGVVWRYQPGRLFEWSVVIGLALAPVFWFHYLPALFVPIAIVSVEYLIIRGRIDIDVDTVRDEVEAVGNPRKQHDVV